jgi:hypothetical protein
VEEREFKLSQKRQGCRIHDIFIDLNISKLSPNDNGQINHHHHRVAIKELGHLLTRFGLTHPEVPSMVFLGSNKETYLQEILHLLRNPKACFHV